MQKNNSMGGAIHNLYALSIAISSCKFPQLHVPPCILVDSTKDCRKISNFLKEHS
jgi:hypothetical protein